MALLLHCSTAAPLVRRSSGDLIRPFNCGVRAPAGNMGVNFSNDKGSQIFSQGSIRCLNNDEFDIGPSQRVNSFISNLSGMMEMTLSKYGKTSILAILAPLAIPNDALAEVCEPDNSLFNMPLLFGIALIGATVGGLLARQRKGELKKLNDQLRQINAALRRQAKIESYAPNLSYAPVGSKMLESEVIVDPRKEQLLKLLRTGKNHLRNQNHDLAFQEFKLAFDLARDLGDHVEEKKAARGLGASLQRQGKYKEAIKYHSTVLDISEKTGEDSGVTEAYGAIADCYTELGELEQAGKFYDKYIARLQND
ncbi:tetratricopeptide repeat (TPR)-like superfamily protein [Carex rostrata]